ncbi:DUF6415 family natural product biosynthesis protein [Streptomyces bicolor]|uniref:DUF6415 family natural product biosynthesis protein n=1 Tax=Streptomyces bicolor TaxID=66874 RepID=UPI0004E0D4FC|nr:DUF6415 family natural product biosynthesis protein [Streptomyces bicolor]
MAADYMPVDSATIREAFHAALWDVRPRSGAEAERLVLQLEGHVRLLAPEVAARVLAMDESMSATGLLVLRHADDALDPAAPSADRQTRLHDLGVVARALQALIEMTDAPEANDDSEADRESEVADPTGWLIVIGPR